MRTYTTPRGKTTRARVAPQGFSLIEILIALFIGALMLTLVISSSFDFSNRDKLEAVLDKLERGVRFAVDEAALRNALVRLRLDLESVPQNFSVEFGPGEDFVLPAAITKMENLEELSEGEIEEQLQVVNKLDKLFNKVQEFQDESEELPEEVRMIGMAGGVYEKLIFGPVASLFVYPSGEKDGALIILATEEEMALLEIEEFTLNFKRTFLPVPQNGEDEAEDAQVEKSKEVFEQWLNE